MKRLIALLLCCLMLPALAAPTAPEALSAYYDEAVFVGDSILRGLHSLQVQSRKQGQPILGQARFLAANGYTLYQGSRLRPGSGEQDINLTLDGRAVSLHDGLKRMEAKAAYIMLGLNDSAGSRLDKQIGFYEKLIAQVLEARPGIQLTILSVSPLRPAAENKRRNQQNLDSFNQALSELCQRLNIGYLDVASALKDESGYLRLDYSSDRMVHLNELGYQALLQALYDHAARQLEGAAP